MQQKRVLSIDRTRHGPRVFYRAFARFNVIEVFSFIIFIFYFFHTIFRRHAGRHDIIFFLETVKTWNNNNKKLKITETFDVSGVTAAAAADSAHQRFMTVRDTCFIFYFLFATRARGEVGHGKKPTRINIPSVTSRWRVKTFAAPVQMAMVMRTDLLDQIFSRPRGEHGPGKNEIKITVMLHVCVRTRNRIFFFFTQTSPVFRTESVWFFRTTKIVSFNFTRHCLSDGFISFFESGPSFQKALRAVFCVAITRNDYGRTSTVESHEYSMNSNEWTFWGGCLSRVKIDTPKNGGNALMKF